VSHLSWYEYWISVHCLKLLLPCALLKLILVVEYLIDCLFCLNLSRHHTEDTDSDGMPPSILQSLY